MFFMILLYWVKPTSFIYFFSDIVLLYSFTIHNLLRLKSLDVKIIRSQRKKLLTLTKAHRYLFYFFIIYRLFRRKPLPSLPNQASEGQAHCMMELAKRLLIEAGGSQSTVIFNASQNIGGQNNPQRNGIFASNFSEYTDLEQVFDALELACEIFEHFRSSSAVTCLLISYWTICFGLE